MMVSAQPVNVEDIPDNRIKKRVKVARAWKRVMLTKDGGLSPDGKTILNDLMTACEYFGIPYEIGNHDRTLELAVKRRVVNHILVALDIGEDRILQQLAVVRDE